MKTVITARDKKLGIYQVSFEELDFDRLTAYKKCHPRAIYVYSTNDRHVITFTLNTYTIKL